MDSTNSPLLGSNNIFDQIEAAYASGASDIEICRILKVRPIKFEERYRKDAVFRELIDTGRMLRRAWWMEQGRLNLHNPKFNRNTWLDYMKNEFGWAEKVETVSDDKNKSYDELKQEVLPVMRALLEKHLLEEGNGPN
jgi:hypothetical protein